MPDLSPAARRVLDAVAAQLARFPEAADGLCVEGEAQTRKHGGLGPGDREERHERAPVDPGAPREEDDLFALLVGLDAEREELPAEPGLLRIRAVGTGPRATAEVPGADVTLEREPPRLVRADLHRPVLPRLMDWLLTTYEASTVFEDVRGVPLATEVRVRMRSRGVGRLRVDQEVVVRWRYGPCP